MKKTIIALVLGAVASAAVNSVQAQGFVVFGNYTGGFAQTAPVTYVGASLGALQNGSLVGISSGGADPTFTASLLYSFGANLGVTYTQYGTADFLGVNGDTIDNGAGLFGGALNSITIPGYSSGACDFIIQVYNGSDYASSTIRGQSTVITVNPLATAGNGLPTGTMFSAENANANPGLVAFTVSPVVVPEPSTLALAGLGGFGMLMALRRKKA